MRVMISVNGGEWGARPAPSTIDIEFQLESTLESIVHKYKDNVTIEYRRIGLANLQPPEDRVPIRVRDAKGAIYDLIDDKWVPATLQEQDCS